MENNDKITSGYCSFRTLMNIWDKQILKEADESSVRSFLHSNFFIMFFLYKEKLPNGKTKSSLFATDEDNRIIFSRIKDPNKKEKMYKSDFFTAIDLKKAMLSKEPLNSENIINYSRGFDKSNLKNIKIVSEDFIISKLKNVNKSDAKSVNKGEENIIIDDEK